MGILFSVWLVMGLFFGVSSVEAGSHGVGLAFSDPAIGVPMPDSWLEEPIDRGMADLNVMLDQQMYRVLKPAIEQYAKKNNLNIALSDGTCGHSAGALLKKKADMGAFCCPPRNSDRLPGLKFYTLGITPIAILVHPDNPVEDLSEHQVRDLFSGAINRWSQLKGADGQPGPNKPIQPVARLHCKPRPGHWRLILDNEDLFSTDLREVGTIPDMVSSIASNVRTIGHVSAWLATEHYQKEGLVKALTIGGNSVSDPNALVEGRYPFYKTFAITTWEGESVKNPKADALAAFILAEAVQLDPKYLLINHLQLRRAGWRFEGDELVGSRP
jgi:phosphate transport system substrate-binding protein